MRFADRLTAARRLGFVGRAHERAVFREALSASELPFQVLHIYGPGGVGKTTLLHELRDLCHTSGVPSAVVDARNVDPSPESFLSALRTAMGLSPDLDPLDVLSREPGRRALLVDTYELLAPLDAWIRDVFLPELPANVVVVLAGRRPPAAGWRADLGWQRLLRTIALRNLSPVESRAYLAQREVPADQHPAVLEFTHGHPLALSLVADVFAQRPGTRFQPANEPDVVRALLEQFVDEVPGPGHRLALESCALVRLTTESLLGEMLRVDDCHELFEWLRGLSFIEAGHGGVFPHDLARDVLIADVRWRHPQRYRDLHERARESYSARLRSGSTEEQQRVMFDYIFLHRDNPVVRPFFEWQESGTLSVDAPHASDRDDLLAIVRRHEGDDSAALLAHWLDSPHTTVQVLRDAQQRAAGLLVFLALRGASSDAAACDPAVTAAWAHLERHAPLRAGEDATVIRFWASRDDYQSVSQAQSLMFTNICRHYLLTPGLAFTFLPCADPAFWAPVFAYADLARLEEADFEVGGRRYGVYGHDWRAVPPAVWQALLAEREIAAAPDGIRRPPAEPVLVLSQPEFESAVRDALRHFARSAGAHRNPLLRSRLVVERAPAEASEDRVSALMEVIRESAEVLRGAPREAKLYQAVERTYLRPAATQELAAEALDLPFSTYRRHLKSGVERIVEDLWQREIGAMGKMGID